MNELQGGRLIWIEGILSSIMADEVPEDETIVLLRQIKEHSERTRGYAGLIAYLCIGICGGIAALVMILAPAEDFLFSWIIAGSLFIYVLIGIIVGCGILAGDKKKELQEEKAKQS